MDVLLFVSILFYISLVFSVKWQVDLFNVSFVLVTAERSWHKHCHSCSVSTLSFICLWFAHLPVMCTAVHNNYSMVNESLHFRDVAFALADPDRALNWIKFKCDPYGETGSWIGMLSLNRISCLWDYHSTSLRHPSHQSCSPSLFE